MAKNPMQRKAQNSFLLGILVTLLITGLIIGFLVIQLTKLTKEKKQEEANLKTVYVLTQDVNSGDVVTIDKLKSQTIEASLAPSNALTIADLSSKTDVIDETSGNLIKKYEVVSKINLTRGTIVTQDMISVQGEITSDIRTMEYNVIQLTSQIQSGKYVDVRLRLANGKDLIVLSHKKIEIPTVNEVDSENTIRMNLDETEILTMSCAIVETYRMDGAFLYVAEYIEPGLQQAATATYLPSDEIINLINRDPNCVLEAKNAIFQRYNNQNLKTSVRNSITNSLSTEDISDKVTEEVQKMQEERQKYLESLGY
ncbi:MAG: SAF domain-containing protein [Clostridia bacterium]